MTRFGAFGIHFCISLLIFAGLAYLVVFHWYPGLFFRTDGGWQGMRIIIGVDLVLGPLLTLIVFKQGKPSLRFDLTCIGVFQALCLVAGVWVVHGERPLAMVYADGKFISVNAQTYRDANMEVPDFSRFPGPSPKWVMVDVPEDLTEQASFRKKMIVQGRGLALAADRYVPFDPHASIVVRDSYATDELQEHDREAQRIPGWLSRYGGSLDDYRFYPLGTRYDFVFLGFRADDQKLLGILETPATG